MRAASGETFGAIERHSLRVFFVMRELASAAKLPLDEEVALCAALLHDVGLFDPAAPPRFYLAHGRRSAAEVIATFGWTDDRCARCLDAIEFHHRLTRQWEQGVEVELLRLADLVDASRGAVRFSLQGVWLRELFRAIPRRGLQRQLLRHSLRGAPCLASGVLGMVANAPRRRLRLRVKAGSLSHSSREMSRLSAGWQDP